MMHSHSELQAVKQALDLERPLRTVEDCLKTLAETLQHQDAEALDQVAAELHAALAAAVGDFSQAARSGSLPPVLRHRLALAGGQVAAQREALARATASLDRAIDVLIPRMAPVGLYSAAGSADRGAQGGGLLA